MIRNWWSIWFAPSGCPQCEK